MTTSCKLSPSLRATLSSPAPLQPLLTHLNVDSSWLLLLPTPTPSPTPAFFSVLIDPWLAGPQSDVTRFLSRQWHATDSTFGSLEEVGDFVREVEECVRRGRGEAARARVQGANWIDAVVISHEVSTGKEDLLLRELTCAQFTDHCHRETLVELAPSVPVFATSVRQSAHLQLEPKLTLPLQTAASLIRSWKHFTTVLEPPPFSLPSPAQPSLPSWLHISRLASTSDALYYHSAIILSFLPSPSSTPQAVIYTPHGVAPSSLGPLADPSAPIETLLLLHGLHSIRLWGRQLNLGAHNGVQIAKEARSRYWVGTHDEEKRAGGIVKWFLKRVRISAEEAMEEEKGAGVAFTDLGNGESLVLA